MAIRDPADRWLELDAPQGDLLEAPAGSPRRGWLFRTVRWLVPVALVAAAAGAWLLWRRAPDRGHAGPAMTYTAARGDLRIIVTESAGLESAENIDIKCEVAGGSKIIWLVDDGKHVKKGDVLVRLDSAKLTEDLSQQKIAVEKARTAQFQAEKDYGVAKIALQEYVEGTFLKDLEEAESKATVALSGLRSAEASLVHGRRMFFKGYTTQQELEAQELGVQKAKLELSAALKAKEVLQRFTRPKMCQDLQSKRDSAEAKMKSEKAALELEEMKLKRIQTHVDKCTIRAPQDGMVIYASNRRWFENEGRIKEGAQVNDQQTLLQLPDLNRMQVKVGVHEAKVELVRPGMPVEVSVRDRKFKGKVLSVANQPQPPQWFSPFSKKYETVVNLEGTFKDLRPGLTAEVEILLDHLKGVISVPVAAVCEQGGEFFCYVKKSGRFEKRVLALGQGNDKSVHVKKGLEAGEEVVLDPQPLLTESGQAQPKPEQKEEKKGKPLMNANQR